MPPCCFRCRGRRPLELPLHGECQGGGFLSPCCMKSLRIRAGLLLLPRAESRRAQREQTHRLVHGPGLGTTCGKRCVEKKQSPNILGVLKGRYNRSINNRPFKETRKIEWRSARSGPGPQRDSTRISCRLGANPASQMSPPQASAQGGMLYVQVRMAARDCEEAGPALQPTFTPPSRGVSHRARRLRPGASSSIWCATCRSSPICTVRVIERNTCFATCRGRAHDYAIWRALAFMLDLRSNAWKLARDIIAFLPGSFRLGSVGRRAARPPTAVP